MYTIRSVYLLYGQGPAPMGSRRADNNENMAQVVWVPHFINAISIAGLVGLNRIVQSCISPISINHVNYLLIIIHL